jgi:hypothetical protein
VILSFSSYIFSLCFCFIFLGDVAAVYETNVTPEQMASGKCKRVEIFKLSDGAEYVLHDIDENNRIVGKVRFLGQIRVPDSVSVIDFKSQEDLNRIFSQIWRIVS